MEYKSIKVEEKDKVARITFNKPPLNVLDIEMMKEINAALESMRGKTLKAVVLDAEGKAFSAGVDVSDHTADKVGEMIDVFHGIFRNLDRIEAPTVALVKGAALGGGCEVAVFCDIIVASEKAKFGQPEIKVGVFPPVAAAVFPKILGPKKAMELLLSGDTIRADEARELGLANAVLPLDNFEEEADKWLAEKIASNSAIVLKYTKKAALRGAALGYSDAIKDIEKIYLEELMMTADANEGLSAFLEKRQPEWKDE